MYNVIISKAKKAEKKLLNNYKNLYREVPPLNR
jgi:hypothetical protein